MSKLNDSTLKILKKYRLDTDMSVFGNENKLYDVVKVMDDMVGNQVSKYVSAISVLNSLNHSAPASSQASYNSVFAEYSNDGTVPTISNDIYIYNALSMKKIKIFKPGDNIFPIGYLLGSNGYVLCYVNLDIERNVYFCSSDEQGTNNLTGTSVPTIRVAFAPYVCFSTSSISFNGSYVAVDNIINGSSAGNLSLPTGDKMAITLPEEIGSLGNKLYYNSISSCSHQFKMPYITYESYITERCLRA